MALTHKYIAIGNPATQGDGNTPTTPYLVRNAAEFDSIMDGIAADSHIHIAAGTYLTKGMRYGTMGWNVRSGWTISGAGEDATIIKFDSWPPVVVPGNAGSKWSVIGCPGDEAFLVSDVVIENLTVDGNWLNLPDDGNRPPGYPDHAGVALNCVACLINGPITHRNLTIAGFYGNASTGTECFALSCHGVQPIDPNKNAPAQLAVFDHCTVHHGHGDYDVGIASFHAGPSIIHGCQIYSLPGVLSKGIQAIGQNIQITNNIVWDCFASFYVDTGNIISLLMEGNHFLSNGLASISTNSTAQNVFVEVRDNDHGGDMDGVYMDVPIRPVSETSPYYRVRLYFKKMGSTNSPPDFPRDPTGDIRGVRIPCPYEAGALKDALEGPGGAIHQGLDDFFASQATLPFVDYSTYSTAASLSPVRIGSVVDINSEGSGTHSLFAPTGQYNFTANRTTNQFAISGVTGLANNDIVTVTWSVALPVPLGTAVEWLVTEVSKTIPPAAPQTTFKLAWMHQIVVLTTPGTGNCRQIPSNKDLGSFTAIGANRLTLDNPPVPPDPPLSNGDLVAVTGGGLVPDRAYVVRNVSGPTFQLAWSPDPGGWIRHSKGAPFVSDTSKVYIQSGWSWTHWKIRNNYLEVPFLNSAIHPQAPFQAPIILTGNGNTDRDYQIAGNVARRPGKYTGIKMNALLCNGIDHVTLHKNKFDFDRQVGESGEALIYRAESTQNNVIPIGTLDRSGNQGFHEPPGLTLYNDLHQWGGQQGLAAASGLPLPGTIRFSNFANGIIEATGFDPRNELRPGDLLATDATGRIGTQTGPFYVMSIDSDGLHATLSRAGADSTTDYTVRRYRGPASYLTAAGAPLFHILNDGSLAVRGIPANLGFGESYLNASMSMTGPLRAGTGAVAAPALSFASDPDTGIHRPASGALGFVTGGVERARLTSAALQVGTHSLAFGPTFDSSDAILLRDGTANTVALRNGPAAQAFRVYESSSLSGDYLRLSLTTQPAGGSTNYLIRTEAGGSSVNSLRSLQLGSGEKAGTNGSGVDTLLHAGQGTGSAMGGAIVFQVAPTGAGGLENAWKLGTTGDLTAGNGSQAIKWGANYDAPAIKSSSTGLELEIRRGDDSSGAALLHRLKVAPVPMTSPGSRIISESESGCCFTNAGSTVTVTFNLPAATTANIGFHCWFAVEVLLTVSMLIHPAESATTIRVGGAVTNQGANLSSGSSGVTLHLLCTGLNQWVALRHIGAWLT